MYYEEKIINGILCWCNGPQGEWTQFTAKQLTNKLQAAKMINATGQLDIGTAEHVHIFGRRDRVYKCGICGISEHIAKGQPNVSGTSDATV